MTDTPKAKVTKLREKQTPPNETSRLIIGLTSSFLKGTCDHSCEQPRDSQTVATLSWPWRSCQTHSVFVCLSALFFFPSRQSGLSVTMPESDKGEERRPTTDEGEKQVFPRKVQSRILYGKAKVVLKLISFFSSDISALHTKNCFFLILFDTLFFGFMDS